MGPKFSDLTDNLVRERLKTQRGVGHVLRRAEIGLMQLQAKKCHRLLAATEG